MFTEAASAEAIVVAVLPFSHEAGAVMPFNVRLTIPASYLVMVVASAPPVSVLPEGRILKAALPVTEKARLALLPVAMLVMETTAPLEEAFTGEPLTFNAVAIFQATVDAKEPAGKVTVVRYEPTFTSTLSFPVGIEVKPLEGSAPKLSR